MVKRERNRSNLLINESPLQVLPSLAVAIGLNEAMILQQVHYWLNHSKNEREGRAWVYKTVKEWGEEFPFFSEKTIRRALDSLKGAGLLLTAEFNRSKFDRTTWYSIDYAALHAVELRGGQNDLLDDDDLTSSSGQDDLLDNDDLTNSDQETTTETTQTDDVNPLPRLLSAVRRAGPGRR